MKKLITMVVVLAMLMTMSTTVFAAVTAADPTTAVTGTQDVTIGDLAIANFADVILNGTTTTTAAVVTDMTITDARGTGAGWSVSLQAGAFTNNTTSAAIASTAALTLPINSLELGAVSIALIDTGSSTPAAIATLEGTIDNGTGVRILSADLNEGMGTYTLKMDPMTLTLFPKSTYEGTYTSTVTMTLTQGPTS